MLYYFIIFYFLLHVTCTCLRSPKDFASASDKVWGHFAAEGLKRTPKSTLIEMGIIKKVGRKTHRNLL